MASSMYRVETSAVTVDVSFGTGAKARGDMFLRPSIVTLSGFESVADRMNDREAFFPLRIEQPPGTTLIGKTQVRYVSVAYDVQVAEPPPDPSGELVQFRMALELDDGEELVGVFHAVVRAGKRRALDFINGENGLFVPFAVGNRQYVVNRYYIRRLTDRVD